MQTATRRNMPTEITPGEAVPLEDVSVVRRIRAGDVQAFSILVRRYNQRLFRLARSIVGDDQEAQDVLQEAYVSAFAHLASFNGPDGFAAWLHTIVRNEAFSALRRRRREAPTEMETMESILEATAGRDNENPERALAGERLAAILEGAIDRLPPAFRVVFVLRAIEGMSVRDTAELLELNEKTVKTRLFRAKRLLRKRLERRFAAAGAQVYEFAGSRCDRLTSAVMVRVLTIHQGPAEGEV